MNVKPFQIALGLAILGLFVVGFALAVRHWSTKGLSLELTAEPPRALEDGGTIEGRLAAAPSSVQLTIDGEQEPLTVDHQGRLELPLAATPPGLHVARLDLASRGQTKEGVRLWERAIEIGVLQGPFEPPERWHSCAIELHVRQALLDDFLGPRIASRLAGLKEIPSTPPVRAATTHLNWAGDGVDALVHLDFLTGTDLEVKGHLAIVVDAQHELKLERRGELEITGRQVAAWHGLLKARLAVAVSAVLGGLSGQGFSEGADRGLGMIDTKVREKITGLLDEKLQDLHRVVPLPGAFAFEGVGFRWRYCRTVSIAAGRSGTIGFDVEEQVQAHEAAATFGLVHAATAVAPPLSPSGPGNIGVDFSPVLLNSLLDAAWRSGRLAQLMNDPRWLKAINERHGDTQLDLKVGSVEPLLPPVLEAAEGGALLRLAETRLWLTVEGQDRPRDARLFAEIHVDPRFDEGRDEFNLAYALTDLAGTCHDPQPANGKVLLTPCYADLLRAVQDRQLETSESSPAHPLALSLRHLLQALPVKLSHIHPAVLASDGQPWFRVTAEMTPGASTP